MGRIFSAMRHLDSAVNQGVHIQDNLSPAFDKAVSAPSINPYKIRRNRAWSPLCRILIGEMPISLSLIVGGIFII
jgi:hypothetical protein